MLGRLWGDCLCRPNCKENSSCWCLNPAGHAFWISKVLLLWLWRLQCRSSADDAISPPLPGPRAASWSPSAGESGKRHCELADNGALMSAARAERSLAPALGSLSPGVLGRLEKGGQGGQKCTGGQSCGPLCPCLPFYDLKMELKSLKHL